MGPTTVDQLTTVILHLWEPLLTEHIELAYPVESKLYIMSSWWWFMINEVLIAFLSDPKLLLSRNLLLIWILKTLCQVLKIFVMVPDCGTTKNSTINPRKVKLQGFGYINLFI